MGSKHRTTILMFPMREERKTWQEKLLRKSYPLQAKQVLKVEIKASCSGYVFGHCFVLVNEQQTWWLRLGAVY